jgi:hypothetical protein
MYTHILACFFANVNGLTKLAERTQLVKTFTTTAACEKIHNMPSTTERGGGGSEKRFCGKSLCCKFLFQISLPDKLVIIL